MRTLVRLALTLALIAVAASLPPQVSGVGQDLAGPMRVRFEAGTHTGFQFNASGDVLARKTATLPRPSGADATERSYITGRGYFLRISNGIWAGYWVRESMVAYMEGRVALTIYDPPRRVSFPAGTIIGYQFDASWNLLSARVGTLGAASGADASGRAVIDGVRYYRIANGGWAGTWVPQASADAVKPLGCETGARAGGGQQVLRVVAGAGPDVALTFDLGGRLDPAIRILRYLLLHGVCSTIFPTGAASQTDVGGQVLAMIRDYPQVFEVGNHTMHHCNLVTGGGGASCPPGRPSTAFMRKELTDAAAIIAAGSGQSPVPYWRPPYGAYDSGVLNAVAGVGYTKTAMWDIDTIDWRPESDGGPTASSMAAKVVDNAENGSIVLMHLGGWNTADALPSMVHGLRGAQVLTPTTISDLLDSD